MKLRMAMLLAVASIPWTMRAQMSVKVVNPGFEQDEIFVPGAFFDAVTGWVVGPSSGVQNTSTTAFPNGVPGGVNFGFVGNANSSGSISQTLASVIQANTTYTLKMSIGQQLGASFPRYIAGLSADGEILASDSSLRPPPGTFLEGTIVYKSGATPAALGRPLTIFVKSSGSGQVDLDAVSLTASAE